MDRETVIAMTQNEVEETGCRWAREVFALLTWPNEVILDTHCMLQPVERQRCLGDYIVSYADGTIVAVEVKAERKHTGNLFLETWSNRTRDGKFRREGWMYTLQADLILFFFLDLEVAYLVDLPRLQEWGIKEGHAFDHPEKAVGLSERGGQRNHTVGHPVPVAVIREGVPLRKLLRKPDGKWVEEKEQPDF